MSQEQLVAKSGDFDKMQAVFDALDAFVAGATWTSASGTVSYDGTGVSHTMTASVQGSLDSFTYSERRGSTRIAVEPISATLRAGESMQFAATATNADGSPNTSPITWSLQAGGVGTITASGLYTAPATIDAPTSVMVVAAQPQAWTGVTVVLQPTAA